MTGRLRALLVGGLVMTSIWATRDAAHANPACPDPVGYSDYCVDDVVSQPGSGTNANQPAGNGDTPTPGGHGGGHAAPNCEPQATQQRSVWVATAGGPAVPDGPEILAPGPRPAADAQLVPSFCNGQWDGTMRWRVSGQPAVAQPAPLPAPEDLARVVYVRLQGYLPAPVLSASPAAGVPAVVNHPTFVVVENWTGTITDQECAFLLCVTVTATPSLMWDPGEPAATAIACSGAGTRFDPQGPPPHQQATAEGACAHAYSMRTGAAADRPEQWTSEATVTWTLTWTSTTSRSGTLPDVSKSATLPREVQEVQVLVEG
jgi:hypothetical protein